MFYERFERLCRDRKISPSRAVQEIGFSRALAAKWKHTGDMPRAETLTAIAKYFGITVSELLGEEIEKPVHADELSEERREVLSMIDGMSDKELIRLKQLIKIAKEGL
jgi:transcriptional regulator with XRE-family HTH domain